MAARSVAAVLSPGWGRLAGLRGGGGDGAGGGARLAEGARGRPVGGAGAFRGDGGGAQVVRLRGRAELVDGGLPGAARGGDGGGGEEDAAVEVGADPACVGLGAI